MASDAELGRAGGPTAQDGPTTPVESESAPERQRQGQQDRPYSARRLNGVPILVLDGGMGTYLEDGYGVVFDSSKPAWSSSADRRLLRRVHADYLAAGADVILTATYQANTTNVLPPGCSDQTEAAKILPELVSEAVGAVAEAEGTESGQSAHLALSIGAYGSTMKPSTEYTGEYPPERSTEEGLRDDFEARLLPYVMGRTDHQAGGTGDEAGPTSASVSAPTVSLPLLQAWQSLSFVAFETLVSATEARAARRALADINAVLQKHGHGEQVKPMWICVNYPDGPADDDSKNDRGRLLSPCGDTPEEIIGALLDPSLSSSTYAPVWGVGINCTKLHKIAALIDRYETAVENLLGASSEQAIKWPWLVVYPDGAHNLKYNPETKAWDPARSQDGGVVLSWAKQMVDLLKAITRRGKWPGIVVGGCCKTTPDDIRELVHRLWGGG